MEDYSKYSKEDLIEIIKEIDRPVTEPCQVAVLLCEMWSCENCLYIMYNADKRTKEDTKLDIRAKNNYGIGLLERKSEYEGISHLLSYR